MDTIIKSLGEKYWIYQGNIKNNLPNDYGKLFTDEYNYYGYFKDGLFNGYGLIEYNINNINYYKNKLDENNKTIIQVDKKINKYYDKNGKTTVKFKKASELFEKNNQETNIKTNNDNISNNINNYIIISYEGEFKEGLKEGNGKILYDNGNIFYGLFNNDKKNGFGKEFNKYGKELYSCIWKDDIINEKRLFIDYYDNSNIKKEEGYIENNEKIDLWKYYDNNEKLIKLTWFNKDNYKSLDYDIKQKKIYNIDFEFIDEITIDHYKNFINNIEELTILFTENIDDNIEKIELLKKYGKSKNSKYIYNSNNKIILLRVEDNYPIIQKRNNNYLFNPLSKFNINKYENTENNCEFKYKNLDQKYYEKLYDSNYNLIGFGIFDNYNDIVYGYKYNNNIIQSYGHYKNNNLINGILYNNGIKIYDGKLVNNKYEDDNGIIYKNGIIHYQGQLKNGLKHGNGIEYNDILETILYRGSYMNDMKHGEGELYDECGELIIRGIFDNNNLI